MFEHLATWVPPAGGEYPEEITVGRETVRVRFAAHWVNRHVKAPDGDERTRYVAIQYDESGRFFSTERISRTEDGELITETVRATRPDQALRHYISRSFQECAFREELLRELENPPLPGMDAPATAPRPRRRKKREPIGPFAVQLEMATALVEVVGKLDAAPDPATLAEARREVSKLHSTLHQDAAMKRATAG